MKRVTMFIAAVIAALVFVPTAGAAKPDNTARDVAKAQCKAEKRADKAAFKATYGKRAMRTCVKGEKSDARETLRNASQECKAEKAEDPEGFATTYGSNKNGKNAHGKCVSSKVKAERQEDVETFRNAAKECRAERGDDRDAFKEAYGSNKNGKNAFGKCVSSKVKDAEEDNGGEEESETA
jgi:hypothetical protein